MQNKLAYLPYSEIVLYFLRALFSPLAMAVCGVNVAKPMNKESAAKLGYHNTTQTPTAEVETCILTHTNSSI